MDQFNFVLLCSYGDSIGINNGIINPLAFLLPVDHIPESLLPPPYDLKVELKVILFSKQVIF